MESLETRSFGAISTFLKKEKDTVKLAKEKEKYEDDMKKIADKRGKVMDKKVDPRMHSAEHLLNQTMDRIFGCGRCFNAHVEKKKSKCDYRFDHPLTEDETASVETRVNDTIQKNLPVSEKFLPRDEATRKYNLGKVPESAGDKIRIVKIGDYDACACIGPHVLNTSEIGRFHIVSTSFDKGALRIRYRLYAE